MKQRLKKYFIPHAENEYHPHILHSKRAVLYSFLLVAVKAITFAAALALPLPAFVLPDVLAMQQEKIIALVGELRTGMGLAPFATEEKLAYSAALKSNDMAAGEYFSHTGPDNRGLQFYLGSAGYAYRTAGENLAMGFSDAPQLVAAWIKSPAHYRNLVDTDFTQSGIGLASGFYGGAPTVYVAAHFGQPKTVPATAVPAAPIVAVMPPAPTPTEPDRPVVTAAPDAPSRPTVKVLSAAVPPKKASTVKPVPPAKPAPGIVIDAAASRVLWYETPEGVVVQPSVGVKGPAAKVIIEAHGQLLALSAGSTDGAGFTRYGGEMLIPATMQEVFKVIVPPLVTVTRAQGETMTQAVAWDNPHIVSPTPVEKYLLAKRSPPLLSGVFAFSQGVYWFALAFFSLALALSVFIEVRRQHPHIIVQTLGLLGMIVVLLVV